MELLETALNSEIFDLKIRDNRTCKWNVIKPPTNMYNLRTDQILMGICCVSIGVLAYINYRVIKIVGKNDKVLVLMIFFLKMALLAQAVFFGFQASVQQGFTCYHQNYYCMLGIGAIWPSMFQGIAMTLTFNKWVSYTQLLQAVKQKVDFNSRESITLDDENEFARRLARNKLINNVAAAITIAGISTVSLTYTGKACSNFDGFSD